LFEVNLMENLHVLVVDDEALARSRMCDLLQELGVHNAFEAATAQDAFSKVMVQDIDVVLLDIQLPGTNGLALAEQLAQTPQPPAVVFVTAHDQHALQAFDLAAVDYLTKPVRRERLKTALERVAFRYLARPSPESMADQNADTTLLISERGSALRIDIGEVLYFKADQKHVSVKTSNGNFLLEESLNQLHARWGDAFVRIHRNALVPRRLIRGLHRNQEETWELELHHVPERLEVSRRNVAEVRHLITQNQT
jgi:two-component system, LytTR family, response regulator AlgR